MPAIIRDPEDSASQARVGTFPDGSNPGDGLVTNAINWLTEPISGIRRLWRGTPTGAALVAADDDVKEITFHPVADALDAGDVAADTQEITDAFTVAGGTAIIQSIVLDDYDDQGAALTLVFFRRSVSLGTEDSAPSISDANAKQQGIGTVAVATTDYVDLGGVKQATLKNVGLGLKAAPESKSLFVAVLNGAGTPTYTAAGLTMKIYFLRN